jgi:hypothetical protein
MTPDQMEDQQNIDSMLLLEGKLQERVDKLITDNVTKTVINIIGKQVYEAINREKAQLMMEISIQIGHMLKSLEGEKRKPLWEYTPEELKIPEDVLRPKHALSTDKTGHPTTGDEDDKTP